MKRIKHAIFRNVLERIPIVRRIYNRWLPNYWENRYLQGGTSGEASVGPSREWKWNVISEFVPCPNHVLDVGCGDLSFWDGRDCEDYVGFDISTMIIKRNRETHPNWVFTVGNSQERILGLQKRVVFCLDLLFHILDENTFVRTLHNLCYYSTKWIFIHTWAKNPFKKKWFRQPITDWKYQYFRQLNKYFWVFEKHGFGLVAFRKNPDKIGALYIFKKS